MLEKKKNLFRDDQQMRLFIILCLSTLFNFALLGVRMYHLEFNYSEISSVDDIKALRGTTGFLFLVWNLFLAWIPYWIALSLEPAYRQYGSKIIAGCLLFTWLLFFPNAPYILTDLLHLRSRAPIPKWYDLMLIASFAWTGLMLGLLSLHEIHLFLKKQIGKRWAWTLAVVSIFLCGFGIYVGRFLRWNSWDIVTNPLQLITQLWEVITEPGMYGNTMGVSIVLAIFLLLAYLKMVFLMGYGGRKTT